MRSPEDWALEKITPVVLGRLRSSETQQKGGGARFYIVCAIETSNIQIKTQYHTLYLNTIDGFTHEGSSSDARIFFTSSSRKY